MATFIKIGLSPMQFALIGTLISFVITFLCLRFPFAFLPKDHGREYAVNGSLSKGKIRGVGLILVIAFIISSILVLPFSVEYIIYMVLLFFMMLSGYLDDAAKESWSDYKKGAIDLILSILAMVTYLHYNSPSLNIGSMTVDIPVWAYFILGIALIWVSVNVTNCSDGVDGLCTSICLVVFSSFVLLFKKGLGIYADATLIFMGAMAAYLLFNCSPSTVLMGDAGSRALGFYLAIISMKSQHPMVFLLLAAVLVIDGGLGLVKIFLLRFFKIHIFKDVRLPLHDHVRKNKGWSDSQVVFRFTIIQFFVALITGLVL